MIRIKYRKAKIIHLNLYKNFANSLVCTYLENMKINTFIWIWSGIMRCVSSGRWQYEKASIYISNDNLVLGYFTSQFMYQSNLLTQPHSVSLAGIFIGLTCKCYGCHFIIISSTEVQLWIWPKLLVSTCSHICWNIKYIKFISAYLCTHVCLSFYMTTANKHYFNDSIHAHILFLNTNISSVFLKIFDLKTLLFLIMWKEGNSTHLADNICLQW